MRAPVLIGVVVAVAGLMVGATCQAPSPPPTFDQATVRAASAAPGFPAYTTVVLRPERYEITDASMTDLIKTAYGVDPERVYGGPSWLDTDHFDIIATMPAGTQKTTANAMLQSLLTQRFQLKVRTGNRPLPIYALTVGKSGSKLKRSEVETGSSDAGCKPEPQTTPPAAGTVPLIVVQCRGVTTAELAEDLHEMAGGYFDHPVTDLTRLTGTWDFELRWTARGAPVTAGSDSISIFDALDKQLGLKAELQQMPMPVIVVDGVSETPTPDAPGVTAKLAGPPPRFEVAVTKPAAPDAPPVAFTYSPGGQIHAIGTLRVLITISLQLTPNLGSDRLVGLPKYADGQHFDILAKVPSSGLGAAAHSGGREEAPPPSVALEMLHGYLEEEFDLRTHVEQRPTTVYALTAPMRGAKLQVADPAERSGCKADPGAVPEDRGPRVTYTCRNTSTAALALDVQQWAGAYIDHPIVDATDLRGGWNFLLSWTPRGALHRPASAGGNAAAGGSAVASDPNGLSIFEAIEQELGLKLQKDTRPISVFVVDHVNEQPKD